MLPDSTLLDIYDINGIPLYNQDVEEERIPDAVQRFKNRIEHVDAILITTPEYNHSYPGVLKNAIDWASRPRGHNSFDDKPVAVMSASTGIFGGVAAQDQLKQVLMAMNMRVIAQPAVILASAHKKFDVNGELVDADAKQFMKSLLANLVDFTRRLGGPRPEQYLIAAPLAP